MMPLGTTGLLHGPALPEKDIDEAVRGVLRETGVPGASLAIVLGDAGYFRAYGDARLNPCIPATSGMRYKIASNGKQITAAAVLLLAEDGKLSLDDTLDRFFPALTRAREITLRHLLSHTAGYRDYYPFDYLAPFMSRDTPASEILAAWARMPLDFEPGAAWRYSNTNYVIVGEIVAKVAGMPLSEFLSERVFAPLGMHSVVDVHRDPWSAADPLGYTRFALGPLRPAAPEGNGWMYAMGDLAMTARDLSLWNRGLMNGVILTPQSMRELTTEVLLTGGSGARYALGLQIATTANGNRRWSHGGGASGFVSRNTIFPDDRASITVLTNGEGTAAETIAGKLEEMLIGTVADPDAAPALERAKQMFLALQSGQPDRGLMTEDLKAYFREEAVAAFAASLQPLGMPETFKAESRQERGGMTHRSFSVKTATLTLRVSTFVTAEGLFAQYLVTPVAGNQ